MELDSKDQTIEVIEELIEQYESLDEDEMDFMAEQDVYMKKMALKSVKRQVERHA